MILSLLARREEPVSVTSTMASARTGGLTSVAPQLNSTLAVTPWCGEVALSGGDEFGGDDFAFQVVDRAEGGGFGDGEDPADFAEALLGVDEVGDGDDVGLDFLDPVAAGEAGIEDAVFDVAGHFLGADEHAFDFGIVDGGEVGAAGGGDGEAGAAEEIDGGVFEAAFGDAEFELHGLAPVDRGGIVGARLGNRSSAPFSSRRKKQLW